MCIPVCLSGKLLLVLVLFKPIPASLAKSLSLSLSGTKKQQQEGNIAAGHMGIKTHTIDEYINLKCVKLVF